MGTGSPSRATPLRYPYGNQSGDPLVMNNRDFPVGAADAEFAGKVSGERL